MKREINWNKADRELSWADWETAIASARHFRNWEKKAATKSVLALDTNWLAKRELRRARLIRKLLTKSA